MITQEYAKKPAAAVKIRCSNCQREYLVEKMLKEEPLPPPYETVVEGIILCPACGERKHTYYMTENLRFRQQELARLLNIWNTSHNHKDWSKYRIAQQSYQKTFDNTQARYIAIAKREAFGVAKK